MSRDRWSFDGLNFVSSLPSLSPLPTDLATSSPLSLRHGTERKYLIAGVAPWTNLALRGSCGPDINARYLSDQLRLPNWLNSPFR